MVMRSAREIREVYIESDKNWIHYYLKNDTFYLGSQDRFFKNSIDTVYGLQGCMLWTTTDIEECLELQNILEKKAKSYKKKQLNRCSKKSGDDRKEKKQ